MVYIFCMHAFGVTVTLTLASLAFSTLRRSGGRGDRLLPTQCPMYRAASRIFVGNTEFFDVEGEAYTREIEAQNLD